VATRPKVHRAELERAIALIASRRRKIDDPHRHSLPDSPDSDPREILDYLRKYSGRDVPRWVLQAEVCDALTLLNWLWWEDRRRELHFLKAGQARGLFLSQLGAQVGVGKQGVRDRIDRTEALLRYDRPDEKLSRAARRASSDADQRRSTEENWLLAHRDQMLTMMTDLITHAGRYAIEDREWLDELQADLAEEILTSSTMVILGLAAAEVRTAPAVLDLDSSRPHGVHTALTRTDEMRRRFADLGAASRSPADRRGDSPDSGNVRQAAG
jgi:hypothetical protein